MPQQSSDLILMIRPASFRMNEETAVNNGYQQEWTDTSSPLGLAREEFNGVVDALRSCDIEVAVYEDEPESDTPDALFPNNWVSFHADGRVGLYPMFAVNRRRERREVLVHRLASDYGREVDTLVDFTEFEAHNVFLEGTGSLILDRINRVAYASIGPRTDLHAAEHFCDTFDFELEAFTANQTTGDTLAPIYHTNVMLALGTDWAVVCDDIVTDPEEKAQLTERLRQGGRTLIHITAEQVNGFAGNVLEVQNKRGEKFIAMSSAAYHAFDSEQRASLSAHAQLIHAPIPTIERCGGGSVRCMMAEVFLPSQSH